MKERERVLELVKQGIISTEEALVLLESMATDKNEKFVQEEKIKSSVEKTGTTEEDINISAKSEQEDKERLEKILDDFATESNQLSADLDKINDKIATGMQEIGKQQEKLMTFHTMSELEATLSDDELAEKSATEQKIKELQAEVDQLVLEKTALEKKVKELRKSKREEQFENLSAKFEIPDDWKETASDTFNQVGEKMTEAGGHIGRLLKKTFDTVTEAVNENVDWKEVNIKVPGVTSTKLEHEFVYPNTAASLINVKVANGKVVFKTWDQNDVKVNASIKLFGKIDKENVFDAFMERSQITVNDETISFQIPNKRIRAELVFYLPKRIYDHVSIKMLNGDIKLEEMEAKDIYTKSTNGDITFDAVQATMIEVEGVNGNVKVNEGKVLDFLADSVNGSFVLRGEVTNAKISIVNGDIKYTVKENTVRKLEANSVNGNIKIALPQTLGVEGTLKTKLGNIKNRFTEFETIRESTEKMNKFLEIRRIVENDIFALKVNTTTGNIYLKDTDSE